MDLLKVSEKTGRVFFALLTSNFKQVYTQTKMASACKRDIMRVS